MRIRAIAFALPLLVGIACKTSSTQGSRTASSDREKAGASAGGQASAGGATASGDVSGSASQAPSASGTVSTPGTSGSTAGGTASTGPSDMKAHSDDRIVSGRIASVSTESLTIKTEDGSDKLLQLVPETSVKVDGQDAHASDLEEGQPVRASFNTVGDREVAVDVRAGEGSTDSMHETGSMHDSGSSGSGSSGTGTSGDTGSTGSGASGTTGSDRKY